MATESLENRLEIDLATCRKIMEVIKGRIKTGYDILPGYFVVPKEQMLVLSISENIAEREQCLQYSICRLFTDATRAFVYTLSLDVGNAAFLKTISKYGYGCCSELANEMGMSLITKGISSAVESFLLFPENKVLKEMGRNHAIVVVGRKEESSYEDFFNWNKDTIICDPFLNLCCTLDEYFQDEKIKEMFYSFGGTIKFHLAARFDVTKIGEAVRHEVLENYYSSVDKLDALVAVTYLKFKKMEEDLYLFFKDNAFAKIELKKLVNLLSRPDYYGNKVTIGQLNKLIYKKILLRDIRGDIHTSTFRTGFLGSKPNSILSIVKELGSPTGSSQLKNALRRACFLNKVTYCELLVAEIKTKFKESNPLDEQSAKGQTALHIAIIKGHIEIARLLLREGASTEIKDHDNKTPFDYGRVDELYTSSP